MCLIFLDTKNQKIANKKIGSFSKLTYLVSETGIGKLSNRWMLIIYTKVKLAACSQPPTAAK